ncbi:MAG: LysM peptidoglycan-binding domain-containing protein [Bryobacteraceae bacterium]
MALEKAKITIEHTGEVIPVMFNPEEYALNKDNNFAALAIPGLSSPLIQFVHGNLRTLDMELFFDTTAERQDVRLKSDKVVNLLKIDPELHAPPVLSVAWGSLQLRCVLQRVAQKFQRFLEDGVPVRVRMNCTFQEFIDPEREALETGRQTSDFTKLHRVAGGDTLSALASRYYQNPAVWRPIAVANRIDDPRSLEPGMDLEIPSLPFTDPASGEVLG